MRLRSFGLSDIGLTRAENEDVWAALPDIGFFALADGMGGHKGGAVAANEAIDFLIASISAIEYANSKELIIQVRQAIEKANRWIYQMSLRSTKLSGMGTTLCCLIWTDDFVAYAHIGDSRVYRLRERKLELLTQDHSLFTKWLATGKLAQQCETPFPYKHVITRALGTGNKVKPEIAIAPHETSDLYFLSSDGLHDVLSLQEMEDTINQSNSLENSCKNLINLAKFKGSSDNITLVMIQSGK
ncbi:MAG TPA: protein phosphatase 2C domain-containing protein [Chlamydiales bacterium]|nr:protein phosphatase 2C domain-containing protein [Chlamydiales bacterium]